MPDSKQVFQLRKEGKHDEAINLAQKLFAQTPKDPWVIKAYGWTLHDGLKAATGPDAGEKMRGLLAEFDRLEIPADDVALSGARGNWRTKIPADNNVTPLADFLKQAKQASDAGNGDAALRVCREALRIYPNASQASMSLGWEIQRALKDLVSQQSIDGKAVQELLQEFARIPHIEKPGNLHSLILARAAQAASKDKLPNFIQFFKWWDPVNLQVADFERFKPEGGDRSFDSRVELAIRGIHKAVDDEKDKDSIAWAAQFVGQHYERFPEQVWFPYYYGQLLVKTGDLTHARKLIIPIVRLKKKDFWSWHTLAGTFGPDEVDNKFSCLCKSLLCYAQDESYLVNVHAELGELLAARGLHAAAKCEVERSIGIRESKTWTIPQRLKDLRLSPWYEQTIAAKSNKQLFEQHALTADALILEGLPEYKAILMHQLAASNDKPGFSIMAYDNNGRNDEVWIKTKQFDCLAGVRAGSLFSIQIDDSAEKPFVVSLRTRNGDLWDLIPDRIGIVRLVNRDKGVTSVVLGKDDFCLFHHDRFSNASALQAGDLVAVKLRKDPKRDKTIPLAFTSTNKEPSAEFFRRFHGNLDQIPGRQFGFVNEGNFKTFVPPDLIDGATIKGGVAVSGAAVLELDKNKNRYGWRAVSTVLVSGSQI